MGLDMAAGKKMSEYTPFSELNSEEKATYLGNAAVTTFGAKVSEGANINVNIPLSTLVPSVPVSDVTVNGSSVVSNGVAAVTVPTATGLAVELAGDGLSVNGSTGKLDVSNKVPAPTATTDRGKVLSVATDSDNIVWSTPAVPEISQYNGDVSAINATNDSQSGGYVFDVNLDTDTLEKRHTTGENQVSYIAVKNPVPSTTGINKGYVLTVDANGDIGWDAPSGGGGGNPYTKVSVNPGARYKNGKHSTYNFDFFDQDVNISNNTYSIVSEPIGYTARVGEYDATGIDVLKIKLPANTEFPMAVLEFRVYQDTEYSTYYGTVNEVEVYVGNTKLTQLHPHPFRQDVVIGDEKTIKADKVEHSTQYGDYWKIEDIWDSYFLSSKQAFVADAENAPIVQVNIFGNCYTINTNVQGNVPSAS